MNRFFVLVLASIESSSVDGFSVIPLKNIGVTSRRVQRSESLIQRNFFNFEKQESGDVVEENEEETQADGAYDEDDPVEKIFGFFFGKREAAPMGLKRMTKEQFPERYPATKTEWAEPVRTDDIEMADIRPLMKNTNLETRSLKLAYDANRDGWNPNTFHSKVDKKGPSIVVCKTESGLVCGGYNPKGWVSYGEARGSIAAFLFVLGGKYASDGPACKLQKGKGCFREIFIVQFRSMLIYICLSKQSVVLVWLKWICQRQGRNFLLTA